MLSFPFHGLCLDTPLGVQYQVLLAVVLPPSATQKHHTYVPYVRTRVKPPNHQQPERYHINEFPNCSPGRVSLRGWRCLCWTGVQCLLGNARDPFEYWTLRKHIHTTRCLSQFEVICAHNQNAAFKVLNAKQYVLVLSHDRTYPNCISLRASFTDKPVFL